MRASTVVSAIAVASCARSPQNAPAPKTFADAVAEVEALTGHKARAGKSPDGDELDGLVMFEMKGDSGLKLVLRHRDRLRPAGAYFFLYEHGFATGPDVVALAPTTDQFDVVRRAGTDGANYDHDNAAVIAWLRQIDHDDPIDVTGAGLDFVEGRFLSRVKDPAKLAERIYSFCPDFVDQGLGLTESGEPHALIQKYFASNVDFFFWWD